MDAKFDGNNFKIDPVYKSCICPAGVEIKIKYRGIFTNVTFPVEACLPCRMREECVGEGTHRENILPSLKYISPRRRKWNQI